jgi:hypothetical protein
LGYRFTSALPNTVQVWPPIHCYSVDPIPTFPLRLAIPFLKERDPMNCLGSRVVLFAAIAAFLFVVSSSGVLAQGQEPFSIDPALTASASAPVTGQHHSTALLYVITGTDADKWVTYPPAPAAPVYETKIDTTVTIIRVLSTSFDGIPNAALRGVNGTT